MQEAEGAAGRGFSALCCPYLQIPTFYILVTGWANTSAASGLKGLMWEGEGTNGPT